MHAITPLEVSILLHYHSCLGDFNAGDLNPPAIRDALAKFVRCGLLMPVNPDVEGARYTANEHPLSMYVDALCAVPLPVRRWTMPT